MSESLLDKRYYTLGPDRPNWNNRTTGNNMYICVFNTDGSKLYNQVGFGIFELELPIAKRHSDHLHVVKKDQS